MRHDSSAWHLIGEGLEFVDGLSWCPRCGTVRLRSRKTPGVYYYWSAGMDITKPVPETEPDCKGNENEAVHRSS